MACCRRSTGMTSAFQIQLDNKVKEMEKIFNISTMILFSRSESDAFHAVYTKGTFNEDELKNLVISFTRAANQFSNTMGQSECPVIHIKGETTIFSCYEVDEDHLLAFYSNIIESTPASSVIAPIGGSNSSKFDQANKNAKPILHDLALLLKNLIV